MMTNIFILFKTMPLDVLWRHLKSMAATIAIIWGAIWWIGGDYVKAQAESTLVEMLKAQGMAPEDFKAMKRKIDDVGRDLDKVGADMSNAARTITAVSRDVDKLNDQLEAINKQADRTYDLLKTLLPLMKSEVVQP